MISTHNFISEIKKYIDEPRNVFEIGSMDGADANTLSTSLGVKPENVWVFEPNETWYMKLLNKNWNVFPFVMSDRDAVSYFYEVAGGGNRGVSSSRLRNNSKEIEEGVYSAEAHTFKKVKRVFLRMETFIDLFDIEYIDVLKLDVEGCSYDVLEGFGNELTKVKIMHVEGETTAVWNGQVLYPTVKKYLEYYGFRQIKYVARNRQCDSIWLNEGL